MSTKTGKGKNKGPTKEEKAKMEAMLKAYKAKCREAAAGIEEEKRKLNFYEQERERLNYIWMTQKKKIEDLQAELLDKQKEREDLEAKHQIERKLYYERIKYIMLKHQDEGVELQKDALIAMKQIEDANRIKEKDYKYDKRSLSKMLKEQEVLQRDFINALKKDDAKALHQLRTEYELKETQIRGFYKERMKEMRNNAKEKRLKTIEAITNRKEQQIKELTKNHADEFTKMRNYYSDLNNKNLNKLRSLAADLKEAIEFQNREKRLKNSKINKKNRIEGPYNKLLKKNEELLKEEEECKKNYDLLRMQNQKYNELMKRLLELEYVYEVNFQKVSYLEKEHDHYMDDYKGNLHKVEQESGLKNLILEKKLEILQDNIEVKEVQLDELLRQTNMNPENLNELTKTLTRVELDKSEMINQLEEELKKIKETHGNMIKTYEAKLAEFGIPVEEIGFDPLLPVEEEKTIQARPEAAMS
ncbi:MAG: hypothetical protein MJ252_21540 [archaeon]|nr:hypothetical protein [archaeon]